LRHWLSEPPLDDAVDRRQTGVATLGFLAQSHSKPVMPLRVNRFFYERGQARDRSAQCPASL
jgi:hypothetical protein